MQRWRLCNPIRIARLALEESLQNFTYMSQKFLFDLLVFRQQSHIKTVVTSHTQTDFSSDARAEIKPQTSDSLQMRTFIFRLRLKMSN